MDRAEKVYRKGVQRWADGDLDGAVHEFTEAAERAGGEWHPWWFAIVRGHASIELERGNFELARHLLRHLPDDPVGIAQQIVLRARVALFTDDPDSAALELSVGLAQLMMHGGGRDVPSLMNGAIAHLWAADILVELGYADEAARQVDLARRRMDEAGVEDTTLRSLAALYEAGAHRLRGDVAAADRMLARVDTSLSIDLPARVTLERARVVAASGSSEVAATLFAAAISQFQAIGHVAEAARVDAERARPATARRDDPLPAEQWAMRRTHDELAAHRPYAVVIEMPVDRPTDEFLALAGRVEQALAARPGVGHLDGDEIGPTYRLFADGDDPHAVWALIEPLIESFGPGRPLTVELRPD